MASVAGSGEPAGPAEPAGHAESAGPQGPAGPAGPTGSAAAAGAAHHAETRDLLVWTAVVVAGLVLAVAFVLVGSRVGVDSPPFEGTVGFTVDAASLLAPVVAALVLWPVLAGRHERLPWPLLLVAASVLTLAWTLALAAVDGTERLGASVTGPEGFLADAPAARADPHAFLEAYTTNTESLSAASQQRPPGPALLLAGLDAAGLSSPTALLVVFAVAGAAGIPLYAGSIRGLCHVDAARRLLPVVVLAPYAVWTAASVDSITSLVVCAAIAVGVHASRPGGSPWWAALAGVLVAVAALMSYAAAWLGLSVLAIYFVRRRPLLPIWSGLGATVPLLVTQLLGFNYWEGLLAARRADDALQAERSPIVWALLSVLLLALCCGPALIASVRKVRNTPGWPFLLGAGLGIAFAIALGLARGGLERSWLPFFPWLVVAAVAPVPRTGPPTPTPTRLVALGAVTGAVLAALLHGPVSGA